MVRQNSYESISDTKNILDMSYGAVGEWFMPAVLKTAEVQVSVGSNPTCIAKDLKQYCRLLRLLIERSLVRIQFSPPIGEIAQMARALTYRQQYSQVLPFGIDKTHHLSLNK